MPSFPTKAALYELRATGYQALLEWVLFYDSTYSRPFSLGSPEVFPVREAPTRAFPSQGAWEENPS